jgi:hypothetical protein
MSFEEYGRGHSWSDLRCWPNIFVKKLRETTSLHEDAPSSDGDLNPEPLINHEFYPRKRNVNLLKPSGNFKYHQV